MPQPAEIARAVANLDRALQTLERFVVAQHPDEVVRAAVIQAFEFCFEACWKVFAKLAAVRGERAVSPKAAFSRAFHYGIVRDETVWLDMLEDRNLTVHTYNEALAKAIFARICDRYAPAFRDARRQLDTLDPSTY